MAAVDAFEQFLASLPDEDKMLLDGYIKEQRNELFAARSEEARLRIVHEFIAEVREHIRKTRTHATAKS
jgi:hypothetical protein